MHRYAGRYPSASYVMSELAIDQADQLHDMQRRCVVAVQRPEMWRALIPAELQLWLSDGR